MDPALLVSLHDVSPLTLERSQAAFALLRAAGLDAAALTVLVIPFHEGRARLDQYPPTVRWLRALADDGATLVLHGLTHRMASGLGHPGRWFWGYGFARGQGELYATDGETTRRHLDEGRSILARAGLEEATRGFVPPAWLLSSAAQAEVERAGFAFYERMGGIVAADGLRARRLVGWGSLTAVEAVATALFARWQARRGAVDTRVAVHPVDVARGLSRRSIEQVVPRLRERLRPRNYRDYLGV